MYFNNFLYLCSSKPKNQFFASMEDFIHLHVHTYYSILDGQSPVQKIVDKAVANGMKGMAITTATCSV